MAASRPIARSGVPANSRPQIRGGASFCGDLKLCRYQCSDGVSLGNIFACVGLIAGKPAPTGTKVGPGCRAQSRHLQTQSLWKVEILGRNLRDLSVFASLPRETTPSRLLRSLIHWRFRCGNLSVANVRPLYGGCAREAFGLPGFSIRSVFHPAYSCHPFVWKRRGAAP